MGRGRRPRLCFLYFPSVFEVFCRLSHNYQHPPGQGVSIIMAFRVTMVKLSGVSANKRKSLTPSFQPLSRSNPKLVALSGSKVRGFVKGGLAPKGGWERWEYPEINKINENIDKHTIKTKRNTPRGGRRRARGVSHFVFIVFYRCFH